MVEDGTQARGVIAICIAILLAGALLGSFIVHPDAVQQGNLNLIIGALIAALSTVVGFYFGSSSGAKQLVASQQEILKSAVGDGNGNALSAAKPKGTVDDPVETHDAGAAPAPRAPAPPAEDPRLTAFRADMQKHSPGVSEEQVRIAWAAVAPIDIPFPR